MGDDLIPTATEVDVHRWILDSPSITPKLIGDVRPSLTKRQAYDLVGFTLRSLVHFARVEEAEKMPSVLFTLALDDDLVDWRDMLRALSIAEDCMARNGYDFPESIQQAKALASEPRRSTIDGYLDREPDMRKTEVMGFQAVGDGKSFTYTHT